MAKLPMTALGADVEPTVRFEQSDGVPGPSPGHCSKRRRGVNVAALYMGIEQFAVLATDGGNYGFSGEAAGALRHGPCSLDRELVGLGVAPNVSI